MLEILYWFIILLFMILAFIGLLVPIIPSVLLLLGAFLLYGVFFSFEPFSFTFWGIQFSFVILLFVVDYLANLFSVRKFGGSKAGMVGSTIGLIIGPFLLPFFGIIIGPFLGAFIFEMLVQRKSVNEAIKIGIGSVVGFIGSVFAKCFIMIFMIVYFFFTV